MKKLKISLNKSTSNLLLALFVLYFSQGVLIPTGVVGSILLLSIFIISFAFMLIMTVKKELTNTIRIWIAFFLIPILSYMINFTFSSKMDDINFSIFRQILINFLPFFPAYFFAKKGILTKNNLILFLLVLLPILSVNFINSLSTLQFERGKEDIVSNAIYPVIGLLPFAFLINRRIIKFGIIVFISFLALQSNKRAAIIICIIALGFFVYQNIYLSSYKNKFWTYAFAFFFSIGILYYAYDLYQQDPFLQLRIELMLEGNSSGRDDIIKGMFNSWYQSDRFINYLFGLGFNSTYYYSASGNVSHNDWLDVLTSYGLVGFFIYSALWISLVKNAFSNDWNKPKKLNYILILIIAFLSSMVFRWYVSPFPFMNTLLLPYLLATKYNES